MRLSKLMLVLALSASLGPAHGADRVFGKAAAMRDIAGTVTGAGASSYGGRYIVVKDVATGLRVYVRTDAETCSPGKPFRASGHLTRAESKDYDATFHAHFDTLAKACQ
jgi:hypothetical protein